MVLVCNITDFQLAVHFGSDLLNELLVRYDSNLDGYGSYTLIETGGWFIEYCDKNNLEENKDLFNFSKNYLYGLVQFEFICTKEFALKWKLIKKEIKNDIEFVSSSVNSLAPSSLPSSSHPLNHRV